MIALRELKTNTTDESSVVGITVVIVVIGVLLMLAVFRLSRTSASIAITDKSSTPFGAPGLIYVAPPKLTNRSADSSVVYYASSGVPFAKMEIPPHLLSLKQLPNGNIEATMPIGRPLIRPQMPTFAPSPTPSQLLYSFDYEPIYDIPPDMNRSENNLREENIYEKPPDLQPSTK
ncbi:unnamed protein product [Angiostrongylus costaricensis]|uniref:APP_amyloid domain-containing protein n=1 Tax=Angiostrongylus costaricensis TaxID=334426 RepID=A0A0R3PLL7_ANGCS|nr:unnamed protein product [Angiostrongylus costaricensis]